MKTLHTLKIVDETDFPCESVYPEIDMKICLDASLEDMLHAFEKFLQAIGYVLPANSYLDFVEESPSIKEFEEEF